MTYSESAELIARAIYERYCAAAKVHMEPWALLPEAQRELWRATPTPNLAVRLEDAAKLAHAYYVKALEREIGPAWATWEQLAPSERKAWRAVAAPWLEFKEA